MKKYLNFLWGNRFTIIILSIFIIFIGYFSLNNLPESIFPNIEFPKVSILVHDSYLPVKYMLTRITYPMEEAAKGEPGARLVRSQTGNGISKIHVYFNSNVNPETAYLVLQSRISRISLPHNADVSVRLMRPNIYPLAEYAMVSNKINSSQMMPFFAFQAKPAILSVNGVYKVEETGRGWPEVHIKLNPIDLSRYDISPSEIMQTLIQNGGPFFSGIMYSFNQQFLVSTTKMPKNIGDFSKLTLPLGHKLKEHIPLPLNKIGKITIGQPPLLKQAKVAGYKHALIMDVLSQVKVNEVKVADNVDKVIQTLKKHIPSGASIVKIYDLSKLIKSSLQDVWIALVIGSIISLIVVLFFIGRFDGALSIFLVIPLSLAITLTVLHIMGYGLNIMTLGGITASIGAMIDHAIVIVERGLHGIYDYDKNGKSSIIDRLKDILPSMTLATLTSTIVFIPLIFLSGTLGLLFKQMAVAIILALISSQLVAVTVTPVLAIFLANRGRKIEKNQAKRNEKNNNRIFKIYSRALVYSMRKPWISAIAVILSIVLGYFSFKNLATAFLPHWDEGVITVPFRTPVGSSVSDTVKIGKDLMKKASADSNVKTISLMVGRSFENPYSTSNKGILTIVLKKNRTLSTEKMMLKLDEEFKEIDPNLIALSFSQIMVNRIGNLSGSHAPLEIILFGKSAKELHAEGGKLYNALSKNKYFESVTFKSPSAGPEIDIRPSFYSTIYGLNSAAIAKQVKLHFYGENAGFILKGEQILPIRITIPTKYSFDRQIRDLNMKLPDNDYLPLRNISNIKMKNSVPYITRQNLVPYAYIWLNPSSGIGLSLAAKKAKSIVKSAGLPKGVSFKLGGYYKKQVKSFKQMYFILFTALMLLLILLGLQFSSQLAAVSAIVSIALVAPFSLLLLLIRGINLDSTAFLGILMVFAIAVNNVILIFSRARQISGNGKPGIFSVALAARGRFRPIIMTMLADIFGFLPLAIGIGRGTDLLKPLATAVIGGLIFGIFASLLIAPSFYSFLMWIGKQIQR
ncbi:MAG: efflux RND transporter permease subunit [Deltaproteobacteria bacterium]|jgi:multidrug efflux pump subunit AcrB|nr:efflux RND transporter permease subunit [Deltaproteobacteria bacterium]MCL5879295.1 efflux RND transporter permease subunit [Deltaproteobacteria bacterium]MDA8305060.1 efflux RND transporter permease subunit [Deltaproteobacteria bacterium]